MPIATLRTSSAHSRGRLASSAEIPYCAPTSSGKGRPTPSRLPSVFQRFCAGRARGEPSAELPAARARRQWFMTEEEGVRLRSSLFLENGSAGVCKAVFAEPIAPMSVKLQGRVILAFLQGIHNQTFLKKQCSLSCHYFAMPYLQSAALTQPRRTRPQAVRTTAQPYTAGRPTPPRLAFLSRQI